MIIVSLLLVAWFATLIMVGILLYKVVKLEKVIDDIAHMDVVFPGLKVGVPDGSD